MFESLETFTDVQLALRRMADLREYTPAWTGTTNPVLNNGTLLGRYVLAGRLVTGWFDLTIGSSTTFGSGGYRISLPVPAAYPGSDIPIGTFIATDASDGNRRRTGALTIVTATTVRADRDGVSGSATTPTAPFTWATGDRWTGQFAYQADI